MLWQKGVLFDTKIVYTLGMSNNKYTIKRSNKHIFFFKHEDEAPELLHIYVRHLTTPEDAITAFFTGKTIWNETNERFETTTKTHTVYWLWIDENDKKILIISCFKV